MTKCTTTPANFPVAANKPLRRGKTALAEPLMRTTAGWTNFKRAFVGERGIVGVFEPLEAETWRLIGLLLEEGGGFDAIFGSF